MELVINRYIELLVIRPDWYVLLDWRFFFRIGIQLDTDIKLNLLLFFRLAIVVILEPLLALSTSKSHDLLLLHRQYPLAHLWVSRLRLWLELELVAVVVKGVLRFASRFRL